jgi:putative transposase
MRKPRILVQNAQYHVVARANRQEFIFSSEAMKELFLTVTKRAKKKYRFSITNFCIMSNHIHFLITPKHGENLSKIMQWILSVFAILYNKLYGIKGHVWYDRFKSKIIDGLRQFLQTFTYIAENPLQANLCTHPCRYRYNGVFYLRKNDFSLIDTPTAILRLICPQYCETLMLPSNMTL